MKRLPKKGDIWRDGRGHFLVVDEHELSKWDNKCGYLCEISILDMLTGERDAHWTISDLMFEEMTFVA